MPDIKEVADKTIKTIDSAKIATERIKDTGIKTVNETKSAAASHSQNVNEYGSERIESTTHSAAETVVYEAEQTNKRVKNHIRKKFEQKYYSDRHSTGTTDEVKTENNVRLVEREYESPSHRSTEKTHTSTPETTRQKIKTVEHTEVKTKTKAAYKSADTSIKTIERTGKETAAAAKRSKQAVKTANESKVVAKEIAKKSAQAAKKSAEIAKAAAKKAAQLAKKLAEQMFGSSDALIRIDMSEYMEKFTVSRLVGAPPGYVGYEEGGMLTEKVRRKPYSIVLLDEIEKAHPDVFNLLLQVMDDGRLTDTLGRTIDFRNTVIIMTSNVGTRQLKDFGRGVGFSAMVGKDDKEVSRSVIQKALNKQFSPEFLNRIDEIITFDQLELDAILRIIGIELKGLYKRVEDLGMHLDITEAAQKFIAEKGYDKQYGARPLRRAIQQHLEDRISEMIVEEEVTAGDTILAELQDDKVVICKK